MTSAWSVAKLVKDRNSLQKKYDKARLIFDAAQDEMMSRKIELCDFRNKYGRVIAMMEADKKE